MLSSKHDVNLRTSYAQTTLETTIFLILISSLQVPVWAVLGYTETRTISRELLLVKVSIFSPEDQLAGGPSHEPCASHRAHAEQTKLVHEMALARHFEEADHPLPPPPTTASSPLPLPPPSPPPLGIRTGLGYPRSHQGPSKDIEDSWVSHVMNQKCGPRQVSYAMRSLAPLVCATVKK